MSASENNRPEKKYSEELRSRGSEPQPQKSTASATLHVADYAFGSSTTESSAVTKITEDIWKFECEWLLCAYTGPDPNADGERVAAAQAGLVCTGVYYGKQQSETETLAAAEEAGSSAKGEGGAS